jgi:sterol desaturase/sphingolipid hydroxylase (fatty acid hydroxylase superfamily)
MASIQELEKEILAIKNRNKKVEIDKAWEISWARKFLLMIFTYLAIGFYLQAINIYKPWLNAIVPSIGFLLSTLTLPYFKKIWERYFHR